MFLARTLGYRSLSELLDTMDSDEYCLWAAEYERSPWGEFRDDLRGGVLAATVANYAGKSRKQNADPAKPLDFMPYNQPEPEAVEPDFEYLKDYFSNG